MSAPAIRLQSWLTSASHPWLYPDPERISRAPLQATILVVDDDPRVRQVTARMLRDEGYRVIEAGSGREALDCLTRERDVRLVLTDIVMPGMHGVQLARSIVALHPLRQVVLMSGYAPNLLAQFGLDESPFPLLLKPFTAEQLARQVKDLLTEPN
jgi:CheY-like chemotaxis protein